MTSDTQVALLRGINVGKAKRIAMADLKRVVEGLGFSNVRTLLNSGNLVYTANGVSPEEAARRIEGAIATVLGVQSRVVVVTADEIATMVAENPLLDIASNHSRLFVSVCYTPEDLQFLQPLLSQDWGEERLALGTRVAYVWCPEGSIDSKVMLAINKALAKSDPVTSRNWATTLKLHAMCSPD